MTTKTNKRPKKKVAGKGRGTRSTAGSRSKKSPGKNSRVTDVYDRERTRHQERGSRSRFTGFKEDGKTKIRVVTFMHEKQECAFEPNFMHFNVPGDRKAVRCPEGDCPICALEKDVPEHVWKGNKAGRGGIKPSNRWVCNAVVRKGPKQPKDELKQLELPGSVWDGINKAIEDGKIKNAFDLRKGVDFLVSRETKNSFTKYYVTTMQTSKPVKISVEPVDLIEALGDHLELEALTKIAARIFAEVA